MKSVLSGEIFMIVAISVLQALYYSIVEVSHHTLELFY